MPQKTAIVFIFSMGVFLYGSDLLSRTESEQEQPPASLQTEPSADAKKSKAHPYANPYDFDRWIFTCTLFTGSVHSDFGLKYRLPYLKKNAATGQTDFYLLRGEKSLPGVGSGSGFQLGGFYKGWSFTTVAFDFPRSVHKDKFEPYNTIQETRARITGALVFTRYTWRSKRRIYEPFVGLGYFSGIGPHMSANIKNFISYAPEINRYVYSSNQKVDVYVSNPFPKIGMSFKLPIQHWKISPFYAYGFESVRTRVRSQAGTTFIAQNPLESPLRLAQHLQNEPLDLQYPWSIGVDTKKYHHRPGLSLYMDYRRFINFRLFAFRNTTYHRWVVDGILNVMFTPNIGITAFGEYGERELATIRYFMIGPTIVFQF